MTPEQQQFLSECPAWARSFGIETYSQWKMANRVVSLPWSRRHDSLDEAVAENKITKLERDLIVKVLVAWDGN